MSRNLENRTIFTGDCLDVLRGVNSNSVDLIYLDPPFNSDRTYGNDFDDHWQLDRLPEAVLKRLLETMGRVTQDNDGAGAVINAAGKVAGEATQAYLTYMFERIAEMARVLKPSGSIYLHCDDTEGAWLKAVMDAVFGRGWYRNEIVWQRTSAHNDAGAFGRVADYILFYSCRPINERDVATPLKDDHVASKYRHDDDDGRGRYRADGDLTGPDVSDGESGQPWGGYDPTARGRHWAVPKARGRSEYAGWIAEHVIPGYERIESVHARLDALDAAGLIYWTGKGTPNIKRYLSASKGQVPTAIWTDIPPVNSQAAEKTGYRTQKPIRLLERIIAASSNEGDLVLDPFCGCATACVAAERLGREWVGIDQNDEALQQVKVRLAQQEPGIALWAEQVVHRTRPPRRTDEGDLTLPDPIPIELKREMYAEQDGRCNAWKIGCEERPSIFNIEVDHIRPRSAGGAHERSNLQLLCGWCNRSKRDRTMEYLAQRIIERDE